MIYIKVNDTLYPATVNGKIVDYDWDKRDVKSITLSMSHDEVLALLPDNTQWSIVQKTNTQKLDNTGQAVFDAHGNPVMEDQTMEFDNSAYSMSGAITDNRDGTCTIKMGKPTEIETILAELEAEVGTNG